MERERLLQAHTEICKKAYNIMDVKNKDYSSGKGGVFQNFEASEIIGIKREHGLLMRVLDKICRLKTFIIEGKLNVINETFEDACLDIINYMVLLYAMYLEKKELKTISGINQQLQPAIMDTDTVFTKPDLPFSDIVCYKNVPKE